MPISDLNTLKMVGVNSQIDYLVIGTCPTGETARVVWRTQRHRR